MKLPSKELLSEVLGNGIYVHVSLDNCVVSWNNANKDESINIYELAYKCKEWANKQNYDNNCFVVILYEDMTARVIITEDGFGFNEKTEPEAIFKATQWILDNKGN